MFLMVNTWAKSNHMDSTRPAPLSMNKLITEYWNSWNSLIFRNSKYRNPRDKTKALVLLKKRTK